jgi:hypothetical protein
MMHWTFQIKTKIRIELMSASYGIEDVTVHLPKKLTILIKSALM